MKQSDAVHFLYRDLKNATSHLNLKVYDQVFEEEMQEYFPFNEAIMNWLTDLYSSEKYGAFDSDKLSLYFEKEHPFLFMRDLAHMNCWNMGYRRNDRRDHITGLMFTERHSFALEATLCLCRPSMINETASPWFDFKQAMTILEATPQDDLMAQAWKAGALVYLYFHLSPDGQSVNKQDVLDLIAPYQETIEIAMHEGSLALKKECARILQISRSDNTQTMLDSLQK